MKRINFFLAIMGALSGCAPASTPTVEIYHMDLLMCTIMDVSCEDFDYRWKEDETMHLLYIDNPDTVKLILDGLKSLKSVGPLSHSISLDVRRKMKIKYEDRIDVVCIDRFNVLYKNRYYEYGGPFREITENLIEKQNAKLGNGILPLPTPNRN